MNLQSNGSGGYLKMDFFSIKALLTAVLLLLLVLIFNGFYVIDERSSALVLQFGEVIASKTDAGLSWRVPLIQDVVFFDKRLQTIYFHSNDSNEIVAFDQKTMKLDAFAKFSIVDPLKFYQAVQSEQALKNRMASVIESSIREIIGSSLFAEVLGAKRVAISEKITRIVNEQMAQFGVRVLDVKIAHLGLPEKAVKAVYQRMITDRAKESKEIRAGGLLKYEQTIADVDSEQTVMLANARRDAEVMLGKAQAEAESILLQAYAKDKEFFKFYKKIRTMRELFSGNDNNKLLLSLGSMTKGLFEDPAYGVSN